MINLFIVVYSFVIFFLSRKQFKLAVGLCILLLPAYLIRFNFGPLPTTLLEVTFLAVSLGYLSKFNIINWNNLKNTLSSHRLLSIFTGLFLFFSFFSIFTSGDIIPALGIWRAYFLEPIIFSLMILSRQNEFNPSFLIKMLAASTISITAIAIIQKITGSLTVVSSFATQGRVTSFFSSPNAVGLYLVPILILSLIFVGDLKSKKTNIIYGIFFILSLFALIFTKSLGSLIGLLVGISLYLSLTGRKKIVIAGLMLGTLLLFTSPIQKIISSKNTSGGNRFLLWSYSWDYLKQSPQNFVFGTGLRQFYSKIQQPRFNPKTLEPLIYPHNIFLNFWTEIGLFGMISYIGILLGVYLILLKKFANNKLFISAVLSAFTALIIHGLIDVPYFKNDLAFIFWIMVTIALFIPKIPQEI